MSSYRSGVTQMKKMLLCLDQWLETGTSYAKSKAFDPKVLLDSRLAPDMYPLVRQVQMACDTAKFTAARLSGKEVPKHPDTETTMEQIRARIRSCVDTLDAFQEADFKAAETRRVELSFLPGKYSVGDDYLVEMGVPNFYFHVCMAYAILRHNGVALGKKDFIGGMTLHDI
ncbi:MAG: DUF1993 domain-containing protein [Myxococcales bacterium]